MDFQLGGINQFPSSSINPPTFMNLDSLRFSIPIFKQDPHHQLHGGLASFPETGRVNNNINNNNLASSIESLSSINQDLHWRLQQQRLAVLLVAAVVVMVAMAVVEEEKLSSKTKMLLLNLKLRNCNQYFFRIWRFQNHHRLP
ncbi:hypothetical protein HanIR_Chr09g0422551 [Helianthus annuus]|nr:hypothetical protein HanIR_Chr09g0422551 [Helianthus annuus]